MKSEYVVHTLIVQTPDKGSKLLQNLLQTTDELPRQDLGRCFLST